MIRVGTKDTLSRIGEMIASESPGAYLRFGDGDCYGAYGNRDSFQEPDPGLAGELREAFRIVDPRVLTAFPHHTMTDGFEEGMGPGVFVFEHFDRLWESAISIAPSLQENPIYSAVALHYHLVYKKDDVTRIISLIRSKNAVLLTSNREERETLRSLFGDGLEVVYCSPRDCYKEVDHLERMLRDLTPPDRYTVVLLAAGLTSRVLVKRLYSSRNSFFFDVGSVLDCFYLNRKGVTPRTWIRVTEALNNARQIQSDLSAAGR